MKVNLFQKGNIIIFGSKNNCCDGAASIYQVKRLGRSENLEGPYLDKAGKDVLSLAMVPLFYKGDQYAGPGHNAQLITEDKNGSIRLNTQADAEDRATGK